MQVLAQRAYGWHGSIPDFRDYTPDKPPAQKMLRHLKPLKSRSSSKSRAPAKVDLREFLPPAYDQGRLHCSTAQACAALVAYFEWRAAGRVLQPSRLFLYKMARKLSGWMGDTGADLRTTLKAMKRFGAPPEQLLPYDEEKFDDEPEAFLYSFRQPYRSISYVRLDARNAEGKETLRVVKSFMAAGFPSVFGLSMPELAPVNGEIPYRPTFDRVCRGQAMMAVGYDDGRLGSSRGGLLVRNSGGESWGEQGYAWLPYAFVEEQLAVDFWTLLRLGWLKSGEFTRPDVVQ